MMGGLGGIDMPGSGIAATTTAGADFGPLRRTGHALFALFFGFVGGVTAKWFYLTRSRRQEQSLTGPA
jgi:hypothetical protein